MIKHGTDEWFKARIGKFSASKISDLMKRGRKKEEVFGKVALTYIREKIAERLTGEREEIFGNALDWGTDNEPLAIKAYEELVGVKVAEAPFIPLKGFEELAGGSPDGLIPGDKGIIECKCPYTSKVHVETLITKDVPSHYAEKYNAQMQMNMLCADADYCDFISFDPRVKVAKHRIFIKRILRDEEFITKLKERLVETQEYIKTLELGE